MKERKPMIPHGKVTKGKHKIILCFETKRAYRTPPRKRRGYPYSGYTFDEWVKREFIETTTPLPRRNQKTVRRLPAKMNKKLAGAKTLKEVKLYTYKSLRLLDECLPQVFVCQVRARGRKTRPKRGG